MTLKKSEIAVVIFAILLRLVSAPTANLAFLVIAGYALTGRSQAIQALAMSWLFNMLNSALAPEASLASVARYLVILAAAGSVAWRGGGIDKSTLSKSLSLTTWLLGVLLLVHSLLFSVVVDVSVLKVISWVLVVVTLISAWQGLSIHARATLFEQLQLGLALLILLSLPLLALPDIGYAVNGTGFQGLLGHPQSFGPTVALAGSFFGARALGRRLPRWGDIAVFGLCLLLAVLSEARTAGLAMIFGLAVAVVLSPKFSGVPRKDLMPGLSSPRIWVLATVTLCAMITAAPFMVEQFSNYIFKRSDTTSLIQEADESRGELVEAMFDNISENPFTGIGFGIGSYPTLMVIERDPVFDLPVSALVEKGVMPVAIVEELGLIVGLAVFGWLLAALRRSARAGVPQFAVVITLLLVNLGESMLFSVGGMGMLLLILLTGAITSERLVKGKTSHD